MKVICEAMCRPRAVLVTANDKPGLINALGYRESGIGVIEGNRIVVVGRIQEEAVSVPLTVVPLADDLARITDAQVQFRKTMNTRPGTRSS